MVGLGPSAIRGRLPAPSSVATTCAPSLTPCARLTAPSAIVAVTASGVAAARIATVPVSSRVSAANSGSARRRRGRRGSPGPAASDRPRSRAGFRVARAPLYCGRNLVPTLLAPSFRHDRAGHWLAECAAGRPAAAHGGRRARRRRDRRRRLRRPLDRLGAERGRARRARVRARGGHLRRRPERPQRRLRQRLLAPGGPALRALRRPRRARGLRARGRVGGGDRRLGASARASTSAFAAAAI